MLPTPSLAQIIDNDFIGPAYVFISVVFLAGATLILLKVKSPEVALLVVGLLTAVAAIGYGTFVIGPAVALAPTLMKIAFLFVLGGLVARVLKYPATPSSRHFEEESGDA